MEDSEHYTSLQEFTEDLSPRGNKPIIYTPTTGTHNRLHIWIACTLTFNSALEQWMAAEVLNRIYKSEASLWQQFKIKSALNVDTKPFMMVRAQQAL